jgi:uncharacterized protein (TIGR02118 family)
MQCTTVLYPYKQGVRFDFDYYLKKHIPMALKLIGRGVARTEVRKGLASPDGSPPTYVCVACIWIADAAEYQAKFAQHGGEIMADVSNFTDVVPVVQTDESLL